MSTAIQFRMNAGVPGDITRSHSSTVEPQILDTTNPPASYGLPCAIDGTSHGVRHVISSDTPKNINGFNVRPFPTTGNGNDGLGVSTPPTSGIVNLMRRGYINVQVNNGTPVKGGAVYARVAAPSGAKVVGGVEAIGDYTGITATGTTGTGTSTAGTLSFTDDTPEDTYTVTLTTTSSTAAFNVVDSHGDNVGVGKIGTQFTADNGLSFLITAGGTPTTGDHLAITVVYHTIKVPGNTYFYDGMDANGNAEVAFNI